MAKRRQFTFVQLGNDVLFHISRRSVGQPFALRLLLHLVALMDDKGIVLISRRELSDALAVSAATLYRAVEWLSSEGLVRVERPSSRQECRYLVNGAFAQKSGHKSAFFERRDEWRGEIVSDGRGGLYWHEAEPECAPIADLGPSLPRPDGFVPEEGEIPF